MKVGKMIKAYNYLIDVFTKCNMNSTVEILNKMKIYRGYYELDFFDVFPFDIRLLEMELYRIKFFLEDCKFFNNYDIIVKMDYCKNKSKINFIKKETISLKRFNLEIPYKNRDNYIDFVYNVNEIVKEGNVYLFVSNVPYDLKSILYVETDNEEELIKLIETNNILEIPDNKSFEQYINEMKSRKWNMCSIPIGLDKEGVEEIFNSLFYFSSENTLRKYGYNIEKEQKKVFISYSHKDKEKVKILEEKLRKHNIPFWLDEYEIQFGKSLNEEISKAMKSADIFILCLSKNCIEGNYVKYEIDALINNIFINKKSEKIAIPLKLDEVNPGEIFYGLENYKYCNFTNEKELNNMISLIIRELS